jgi:hypothetical protein
MASKRPVDDNQRLWRRASVAPTAAATTSRNRTLPIEKKEKEKSSSSCPVAVGRFFFCFLFSSFQRDSCGGRDSRETCQFFFFFSLSYLLAPFQPIQSLNQ